MFNTIFWSLFRAINFLIPKNDNKLIFTSRPDYADNAYAFYQYLVEHEPGLELIWIVNSAAKKEQLHRKGIRAYLKRELSGLFQLMTARFIVETHGQLVDLKCGRQVLIELWHGKSIKATGLYEQRNKGVLTKKQARYKVAIDYFIAGSNITRSIIASGFGLNPHKVVITGQPRNDRLINSEKRLAAILKMTEGDLEAYEKVILYVPTFRRRSTYADGLDFNQDHIFNFVDYDQQVFTDYLKENNLLFLIKMHPAEEHLFTSRSLVLPGNVQLLTSSMLGDHLTDLYDCLNEVDLLVSDYSSLYFDFLLLNRQLIFIPTDIEEYSETRGLVLEPYEFWAPGPKVTTMSGLLGELDNCIRDPDYYGEQRRLVNMLINHYHDPGSARRVYNLIRTNI